MDFRKEVKGRDVRLGIEEQGYVILGYVLGGTGNGDETGAFRAECGSWVIG